MVKNEQIYENKDHESMNDLYFKKPLDYFSVIQQALYQVVLETKRNEAS